MVTVVGQVPSKDVELTRNHPPRVSHLDLILWGQENPEMTGREGSRLHCWAFPGAQAAQRAVRHLQEQDKSHFLSSSKYEDDLLHNNSVCGVLLHSQRAHSGRKMHGRIFSFVPTDSIKIKISRMQ